MDMERSKDADYEDSVIDACWTMETDKLTSSLALPRTVLVLNQKDEKTGCLFVQRDASDSCRRLEIV